MDIITTLKQHNIPFYFVGGYVRDQILNRASQDVDLIVDKPLEEVYPLIKAKKSLIKGQLIRVMDIEKIEISRMVEDSLEANLRDRDFTVNAMAMTPEGDIIDYLGGLSDCQQKLLRIVSEENLVEDFCRAIKGVRQAAELNFTLEETTKALIIKHHCLASSIAPERIMLELNKILLQSKPSVPIEQLRRLSILKEILPEVDALYGQEHHNPHHHYDIYWHTLHAVDNADITGLPESEALILRLAALGHDIGKLSVRSVNPKTGYHRFIKHQQASAKLFCPLLNKLTYGHSVINRVSTLISEHMRQHELIQIGDYKFRKFMYELGQENTELLLRLFQADTAAKGRDDTEDDHQRLADIRKRMESCTLEPLAITGKDILEGSSFEGPQVGKVKDYLQDQILQKPQVNRRDLLLQMVAQLEASGFAKKSD